MLVFGDTILIGILIFLLIIFTKKNLIAHGGGVSQSHAKEWLVLVYLKLPTSKGLVNGTLYFMIQE